jgi:hypothetical protein
MIRSEVVIPIGDDDQDWQLGDPATDYPQQLEGPLIRPLHVFEHDDPEAALSPQPARESGKNPVPITGRQS